MGDVHMLVPQSQSCLYQTREMNIHVRTSSKVVFLSWKGHLSHYTQQREYTGNSNNCFQKWNCAASVPIPTFMFLWAIYIFPRSVCLFCCSKIGGPIVGTYKSLTEIWLWKLGLLVAQCLFWEYINRIFFAVYIILHKRGEVSYLLSVRHKYKRRLW